MVRMCGAVCAMMLWASASPMFGAPYDWAPRCDSVIVGGIVRSAAMVDSLDDSLSLPLPVSRPLAHPPDVSEVGSFTSTDRGVPATIPVTAALAVQDLQEYAGQLDARFPLSARRFPIDSIRPQYVARAQAWLVRLQALHGPAVEGRQRIPLAMVAFDAGQDRLAQEILNARLGDVRSAPAERSLTLAAAVSLFLNSTQDDARLARNIPIAMAYATQLMALPTTGYPTRSDSTNVRQRVWTTMVALLDAMGRLRDPAMLLAQIDPMLSMMSRLHLPYDVRSDLARWRFPYNTVAAALVRQPDGRARLDTLNARLLRLAARRSDEWPSELPVADRPALQTEEQARVRETFHAFAMIGKPAPPVLAHAWLNTADSSYAVVPRTHAFTDGVVRVLAFGRKDDRRLPLLEQIQRQFLTGVQVMWVTTTEGHAGPDLVGPAEEVAWLRTWYTSARHLTFPIAVWAGAKVPQEQPLSGAVPTDNGRATVGDGQDGTREASTGAAPVVYQRYLPTPSPMWETYHLAIDRSYCVIVDGHGVVRGLQRLATRAQAVQLVQMLVMLRADMDRETPLVRP